MYPWSLDGAEEEGTQRIMNEERTQKAGKDYLLYFLEEKSMEFVEKTGPRPGKNSQFCPSCGASVQPKTACLVCAGLPYTRQ